MREFTEAATSFPAVVFTVLLALSVLSWGLSGLLDLIGSDLDAELDLDGGPLAALDLDLVPVHLAVAVISLVGWVTTMIVSLAVDVDGPVGVAFDGVVLMMATAAGVTAAGRVARVVAPVFSPDPGPRHRDLLGRLCTVRTGRVDAGFGQAEVVDDHGGLHLVQVRCAEHNDLTAGDRALVVDLDGGVFVVSPDIDAID